MIIDLYREAANVTEYHIISKLIFFRIIIPKFIKMKIYVKCQISTIMFKWTYGLFGHNYRVAMLSTLYLTI